MTDIETRLRHTFGERLDRIEVAGSLPPEVKARARRGRALVMTAAALGAVAVSAATALGVPALIPDSRPRPPTGPTAPAFPIEPNDNGRIAYSLSGAEGMELHSVRPDGSDDRVVPTPEGMPWLPAWSPDGSKLAVSIFPNGAGSRSIWVMDADGSDAHRVASADNVSVPAWSPDGRSIIYTAQNGDRTAIHVVAEDGKGDKIIHGQTAGGTFAIFSAQFSPDGTKILFDRGTDSGFDIFVMNADGSDPRRLTSTGTDYDPSWSPDGMKIAFTREEIVDNRATSDIFVMDADGGNVRRLTDGDEKATNLNPTWAPDGTKIAYVAGVTGGPGGLVVINPDGSEPVELVEAGVLGVSWQPRPASSRDVNG